MDSIIRIWKKLVMRSRQVELPVMSKIEHSYRGEQSFSCCTKDENIKVFAQNLILAKGSLYSNKFAGHPIFADLKLQGSLIIKLCKRQEVNIKCIAKKGIRKNRTK